MQFVNTALFILALAVSAMAQLTLTSINIPAANSVLTPGTNVNVQVGMDDYIQNIENLVLVVGLQQCYNGVCSSASESLGAVLYDGPYDPYQTGDYSSTYHNFYQNVTIAIPSNFPSGAASLTVLNLYAVGDEYGPNIEYLNQNITIA